MKKLLYSYVCLLVLLSACRKATIIPANPSPSGPGNPSAVQLWLKNTLSPAVYADLVVDGMAGSKQGDAFYWKLAFKTRSPFTDFLLLRSDSFGHVTKAKWIQLSGLHNDKGGVNGNIAMRSLNGEGVLRSTISNGYIEQLHPKRPGNMLKTESLPGPYDALPEVIIVAYRPNPSQGYSFGTFILFQSLMADMDAGGNYYNNPVYSYGGGGGSGTAVGAADPGYIDPLTGSGIYPNSNITLNIEKSPYLPGININAWLDCFQSIPDEGASFSVTICADLPVDDDPSVNVNFYTGATGHTFLELKKTNGGQSITQVIGFTAQNALGAIAQADGFVPSKIVDNGGHKYDASITMQVNAGAFTTVLDKIKQLGTSMPYSITKYDCLDFDLGVVNAIRGNDPLVLPTVAQQSNAYSYISTGERFYNFLADMKSGGSPEAGSIWLGGGAGVFAGASHGTCN